MSSATELRRALSAASVDSQVAEDIITKAVKAGEVVDDAVTPEQIDAAMEAITKSLGTIEVEETEGVADGAEVLAKAYYYAGQGSQGPVVGDRQPAFPARYREQSARSASPAPVGRRP
jgi:hypothetical protein